MNLISVLLIKYIYSIYIVNNIKYIYILKITKVQEWILEGHFNLAVVENLL